MTNDTLYGRPVSLTCHQIQMVLSGQMKVLHHPVEYCVALGHPEEWCPQHNKLSLYGNYKAFCPLGYFKDVLWVREPWAELKKNSFPNQIHKAQPIHWGEEYPGAYAYYLAAFNAGYKLNWQPADEMPHWASRLSLTLRTIAVEQTGGKWFWAVSFSTEHTL